ncbi:hypothetical protein [Kitasatospora sp. NPDC017646]|uniref:hypothetical protein n=1 Tax=Kitasatospora sp. NPDC017646 TaxID=3364024 RepID=UPI0037991D19
MILNHPDQIGNLDGIPAAARDQANRTDLKNLVRDRRRQLNGLGPEPKQYLGYVKGEPVTNPEYEEWKAKHDALKKQLDGYDKLAVRYEATVLVAVLNERL